MKHHPVAFGYLTNKQIICLFSFPPDTANKCRIKTFEMVQRAISMGECEGPSENIYVYELHNNRTHILFNVMNSVFLIVKFRGKKSNCLLEMLMQCVGSISLFSRN